MAWPAIRIDAFVILLRRHLRTLALDSPAHQPLSPRLNVILLAAHLLGLTLVCRLAHWPPWLAPLILAAFCLPQILLRRWFVESLAPLLGAYGLAALRLGIVYGLRQEAPAALSYEWAVALGGLWTGLIFLQAIRRLRYVWIALAIAATALMAYLLHLNRPAGVTGSDPFAYVQMALDLTRHGTPRHHFPLAPFAASLGLPTLPTVHVGYVLPNADGLAPTVWPPGYSALLAAVYPLGGEAAMLSLNLWIGLLCLGLTLGLALLVCPTRWRRLPLLVGMGAVVLLATSPEQLTRLVVPLADGAAQALTTLAIGLALYAVRVAPPSVGKGERQQRRAFPRMLARFANGGVCGLALAAAYSVRYTQILVGPGIALIAWLGLRDKKTRSAFLTAFLASALLGAAPDALYRTHLYGAPWRFGTGELALFSLQAVPQAVSRLGSELLSLREFGWLWPLALVGAAYLWRRDRFALAGLAATYAPLTAFHLWYPFLRLRDVLSLYPVLAALCALGGAVVLTALWRRGAAARLPLVVSLFALGMLRLTPVLGFQHGFFTFGYLFPEQRGSLEAIAALTEAEAVIACSLNSGAVELYGERETVRPGNLLQPGLGWDEEQWLTFAAALRAQGRPLYLLMDSPEMEDPLAALQGDYAFAHVADLDVPVYFVGGGSRNLTVPLYRVAP